MTTHYSVDDIEAFSRQFWPESESPAHRYLLLLHRLSERELQQTQQVLQAYELSLAEFDTLASLRRSAAPRVLSPTELQRSTLLSSGGQTKLLHKLEEKGWIARSCCGNDKRSKLVHLTAAGQARVEAAMDAVLRNKQARLEAEGVNAEEVQDLCEYLQRLLQTLDQV